MDATMTVRLNSDEKALINSYTRVFGTTASQLMRKATLEMIEDQIDIDTFKAAKLEYEAHPVS
ncbi:type II toxin-antitoxin system RelB family antitoxin [Atopobium sp. oral taxon 810]|uniref:type II toxin-antitoxin system RelB family antitoxin n=1 Tax=Atopobium sp. oral taxon 810 TaxID=712158 RepID=UPI0003975BB6|nr:DUF6290 family protein [Atopobium sp. oral taxon 810]ERI05124.1 putative toxin-antitoxin system, antitoxin component, ribbon-helix-helix domain protein [Atopobium sp. oral taxon 810 str. F0209]